MCVLFFRPWEVYPTASPSESCAAINIQGKFVNLQCVQRLGYICQIDNTTGMYNSIHNSKTLQKMFSL